MNKHHTINYIEFPVKDIKAVKDFYSNSFGWKFTDYGPNYIAFKSDSLEGGFDTTIPQVKGGTLVVLYSDDLESSIQIVKDHDGKITKDIFIFPGGRRFHFSDPSGNELAIWSDK